MRCRYAGVDWVSEKHDVIVADEAGAELVATSYANDEKGLRALRRATVRPTINDAAMQLTSLIVGTRQTIAGTVYGTIVVLSVVTAGSTVEHDLWRLAVIAAATVAIYWLAHVYSDGLGESLNVGRRLTAAELGAIARRERSILLAAVLPVAAILLGALGVLANRTALWVAVGIGVATLTVQGLRYARLERLSPTGTIVTVAINLALGLVIVALKALVVH